MQFTASDLYYKKSGKYCEYLPDKDVETKMVKF